MEEQAKKQIFTAKVLLVCGFFIVFYLLVVITAGFLDVRGYSSTVAEISGPAIKALIENGVSDFETEEEYLARTKVAKLTVPLLEATSKGNRWYFSTYSAKHDRLTVWLHSTDFKTPHVKVFMGAKDIPFRQHGESYFLRFDNLPNLGGVMLQAEVPHKEFARYTDKIQLVMEYRPLTYKHIPMPYTSESYYREHTAGVKLLKLSVVNIATGKVYGFQYFSEENKDSKVCEPATGIFHDKEGRPVTLELRNKAFEYLEVSTVDDFKSYELTGQYEKGFVQAGPYLYDCARKQWVNYLKRDEVEFTRE